jgi:hypothetical protein
VIYYGLHFASHAERPIPQGAVGDSDNFTLRYILLLGLGIKLGLGYCDVFIPHGTYTGFFGGLECRHESLLMRGRWGLVAEAQGLTGELSPTPCKGAVARIPRNNGA